MEHSRRTLADSLELASAFSTQINTGVPVEIVEAENQAEGILTRENGAQNITAEDAMEISVEGDAQGGLDSTQLSAAPRAVELPVVSMSSVQAAADNIHNITIPAINNSGLMANNGTPSLNLGRQLNMNMVTPPVSHSTHAENLLSSTNFPSSLTSSQSILSSSQTLNSSQLARTVMEQLSETQGLEIIPEAITSLSVPNVTLGGGNYTIPQINSYSTPNASSLMSSRSHQDLLGASISYGDLELSVGANSTDIDGSTVLNEPDSPSSPESNFDSSELLSNPLTQQDEVTQRLAQSGLIGVAAAAAIMSGSRKRKRQHSFETNPSFRKRHCSKLTKKLKETIDELTARVGLQAVVVTYRPGKGNGKNEPSFKVFGAAPLVNIVKNQQEAVVNEMEAALHQQAPTVPTPPTSQHGEPLYDLPPLIFEGIPTPVHKMTQAQLRTFIPNMLKFSTGRGKPGWGKDDVRPPWWPDEVPWANVRSDVRTPDQKRALQWTDALRRIVINCYLHHGRMDLLPEFSIDQLQQFLTPQVAEQLQTQLDNLQQQQTSTSEVPMAATTTDSAADEVAAALNEITEASGGVEGRDDPEMMVGDNQQVFTVDTGLGNCDMTGMPTLADASLAETAARLQQLADETGEVRYATQTVTVTDRDAKALGQPVGSTTTVLLTAYPGGHSGAANAATTTGEQLEATNIAPDVSGGSQQFLTSPSSAAGNVQVVYSASHVDPIPSSDISNSNLDFTAGSQLSVSNRSELSSLTGSQQQDGGDMAIGGVNDYLNPAPGREVMLPHTGTTIEGANEGDASGDLAAQLIREYSMGGDGSDGLERKSTGHLTTMVGVSDVQNESSES